MGSRMRKENPQLIETINMLKKAAKENNAKIWKDIAERLERPLSVWYEVNVSKIERYAKDGDVIVVPGKVLGAGNLTKKVVVAAWGFTKSAKEKIERNGGRAITIAEILKENPKGSNVRIFG